MLRGVQRLPITAWGSVSVVCVREVIGWTHFVVERPWGASARRVGQQWIHSRHRGGSGPVWPAQTGGFDEAQRGWVNGPQLLGHVAGHPRIFSSPSPTCRQ